MSSGADASVVEGLRRVLADSPDTKAVYSDSRWFTWHQLENLGTQVVALLSSQGVPDGSPVSLVMRNRPTCVAAMLGLMVSAHPPALISPIQPPTAIVDAIRSLDFPAIVADRDTWDHILIEAAHARGMAGVALSIGETGMHADVVTVGRPTAEATWQPDPHRAFIVPTSGTTGPPKYLSVAWEDLAIESKTPKRPDERSPYRPPVIHSLSAATITGSTGLLRAIGAGRQVALMERLDLTLWSSLVREFKPRRIGLPPAAMRTMLEIDIPPEDLASVEAWVTGSAPLDPVLQSEFEMRYSVPVLVAYGATEFGGAVASWTLDDHHRWAGSKLGSVGRAVEGVELRVTDPETDAVLPPGHVGLLEVLMRSGYRQERGWVRTNDLARLDGDGFLFIEGRADDVIVRGGFKISLGEIESLFRAHGSVRDVAAVGLPHPRLGEVPGVLIEPLDGAVLDRSELLAWARERTAPYKLPVVVEFTDNLPRVASQKVSRPRVRELLLGRQPQDS